MIDYMIEGFESLLFNPENAYMYVYNNTYIIFYKIS